MEDNDATSHGATSIEAKLPLSWEMALGVKPDVCLVAGGAIFCFVLILDIVGAGAFDAGMTSGPESSSFDGDSLLLFLEPV